MDFNALILQVSTFATSAAANAWTIAGNFLALLVLTVVMIIISYRGRGSILALTIAMYVGYAIFVIFPYTSLILSWGGTLLIKALLSIILYLIACVIPYLFIHRLTHGGFGVLSFVPRFVLSFLAAAFVIAIAYHLFGLNHLYTFPKPLDQLFASNEFFFLWFVAPLFALFFLVH